MRKFKTTAPSKFERALAVVSPRLASARYRNRLQFEAASYYSGSTSRRPTKDWTVPKGHDPDSDMWLELDTMRDRSRDLIRNNPLACGAIKTKVTSIIGAGLLFQARVDGESLGLSSVDADELNNNIEREFNAYFESTNCDIERASTFGRLQALAFRSQLENGDVFVLLPYLLRGDDVYGTKIQLIEADRVSNADNASNNDTLFNGIEFDKATGINPGDKRMTNALAEFIDRPASCCLNRRITDTKKPTQPRNTASRSSRFPSL